MASQELHARAPKPTRSRLFISAATVLISAPLLLAGPSDAGADARSAARSAAASPRAAAEVGLLTTKQPRARIQASPGKPREVGMKFRAKVAGTATGLRYYKRARGAGATPTHATLWSADATMLARTRLRATAGQGWRTVDFPSPVELTAGTAYVVSVHMRRGNHAVTRHGFDHASRNAYLSAPGGRNGWTRTGRTSRFPRKQAPANSNYWVDVRFEPAGDRSENPAPTPTATPPPATPPPAGGPWPGPDNTGVPAGTALTPYTGPCTITSARTISGVDATGACDALLIHTRGVVIEKSVVPRVESTLGDGDTSFTITDSDVRAGQWSDGALWGYNITARRVDVTGGQHSFHCNDNCELTDSWLHDQYNPDGGSYHNNAFISNGGTNMLVRHNTLHCTPLLNATDGGCTSNVSLFGDFDPISRVTVDNNLLKANNSSISYCAYGGYQPSKPFPVATYIVFTNNVFERGPNRKCGVYGPVTSFQRSATGNQWSGNVWDTGEQVNP